MSNIQLGLLISVIVGVGVMIAFGPRFLDHLQAERDDTHECTMFRMHVDFAFQFGQLDDQTGVQRNLGEALNFKKAGNCIYNSS